MAKDEWEDDADEEELEEEMEQPAKPRFIGRPPKDKEQTIAAIKRAVEKPEPKENKQIDDTYEAYHYPERQGIKFKDRNEPLTEDLWGLLCIILNKLERLEKSIG